MIKVAIIDDGVNSALLDKRMYHLNPPKYKGKKTVTHGTICATVLLKYYRQVELYDVNILNSDGHGDINDLLFALDWCNKHSMRIINMSLTTRVYYDLIKLESILNKLIQNGIFIVCSLHNSNTFSYPALFKGVFGVRIDHEKVLKPGEVAFDLIQNASIENSMIAECDKFIKLKSGKKILIESCNSFVTPVVTAKIAEYVDVNHKSTINEVLEYFCRKFVIRSSVANVAKRYSSEMMFPIQVPVLGVSLLLEHVASKLVSQFSELGYNIVTLSEGNLEKEIIPINFYCLNSEKINQYLISHIERVYSPDLIFIIAKKNRFNKDSIYNCVDYFIDKIDEIYCIESAKICIRCLNESDIFFRILSVFR